MIRLIILFMYLMAHSVPAHAHNINTSYLSVEITENVLTCEYRIDQTDLQKIFYLDENGDGTVTREELFVNLDNLYDYVEEEIEIIVGGEILELDKAEGNVFEDQAGNVFVDFMFRERVERQPWKVAVGLAVFDDFGPKHKCLTKVIRGDEVQQTILTIDQPLQAISFTGQGTTLLSQIAQFVWLGMEHIFIGYDHILFLIALIVIGGSFVNLVKIVSSFTVAHSITLILAALQVVVIPSKVVESVIALSIVYIAVENFVVKDGDQRWLITFIFGLMHGFGFAGVLTELGLPTKGLLASLFSFNIGVELGQIAIVSVIYPVVFVLSRTKWRDQMVYGLSSLILIFGLAWFLERAFELDFPLV
ncbi:hypothetical protein GWN42_21910 [candidate division KSB1 bacterium]|nr:hypothetical protein [candidate division KSB1 bacterium]